MSMPSLRPVLEAYLRERLDAVSVEPLQGDASTRRFFRIVLRSGEHRVLMDYGRPFSGETDDVRLTRIFQEAGLRVAGIHAIVPEAGCLLLEDLGDLTLEAALLRRPPPETIEALQERSIALAARIAMEGTRSLGRSERARGPALDADRFRYEMAFFIEHYVEGLMRRQTSASLKRSLEALAEAAAATPRSVLCHRDFHSRNLMVLPDGELAMVDIQDAQWGPDTYDLASLLRDAYIDLGEDTVDRLVGLYLQAVPPVDTPAGFCQRLHTVSCQRMIKALGTFGYQSHRQGRTRYLEGVPRTLARLDRLLPTTPPTHDIWVEFGQLGVFASARNRPTETHGLENDPVQDQSRRQDTAR